MTVAVQRQPIQPARAPVRPHVVSPETGDTLLLEDAVEDLYAASDICSVQLTGATGAGKTTAIAHLADMLPQDVNVLLLDDADPSDVVAAKREGQFVVFTAPHGGTLVSDCLLRLAPWTNGELIEYLLAVHPSKCKSVMQRVTSAVDIAFAGGLPAIWRPVLDEMARDESLTTVRAGVAKIVDSRLTDTETRRVANLFCLAATTDWETARPFFEKLEKCLPADSLQLLSIGNVQMLLAAGQLASLLADGKVSAFLAHKLQRAFVEEIAIAVRELPEAITALKSILRPNDNRPSSVELMGRGRLEDCQPMAASILHVAGTAIPFVRPLPNLNGAYLNGVHLSGLDFHGARLREADLPGAMLQNIDLTEADAHRVNLNLCNLQHAGLERSQLCGATLLRSDLSHVNAASANLEGAVAEFANFSEANLVAARFGDARLKQAHFAGANLSSADLRNADVQGADFSRANLQRAQLAGLPLREAILDGAYLWGANLQRCDLEYVVLDKPCFVRANLSDAYLTGSRLPGASFVDADLRGAGLADIDWPGANLRNANLGGCSFFLGSSRSGLVGSPIASEGSRTGFYTDDYDEQYFKAPEEIRKANLCGADLRGAKIAHTDFYLVDLRGAKYSAEQREHFQRCGAILDESRS